ncbi:MAG: ABC transporter permease [Acidobacteriota bacterium]|nr:ABC transporter permease [Blastocatellia bacterium]MDW8412225.1 ABC transporter permease [Acidobacteriota bacterium]
MSKLQNVFFPLLAVVAAFIVGAIVIAAVGDDPLFVYGLFFSSVFGTIDGLSYTLFYATPLIFTGLAVALAFHCGLLNIGAEGQLQVAAFVCAWIGFTFNLPGLLLVPMCMLGAVLAGAIWAGIPGLLKARFGSHEVINTIMMNFIAAGITSYLTQYFYREPGDPILQTKHIYEQAHIARIAKLLSPLGVDLPQRLPLNLSLLIALAAAGGTYFFLWHTRWGYDLRAVGANPAAAQYGGVNVARNIVLAMCISGALAGMVAIGEVQGYRYRYYEGFSAGYGFTGIAVALLGRNHPLGIVLAALLFGALQRAGLFIDIFTDRVSKDLTVILQATIILFVGCEELFRQLKRRWAKPA